MAAEPTPAPAPVPAAAEAEGATATALYDYEAAEDNELSFPENAIIHNVVSSGSALSAEHSTDAISSRRSLMKTGGMASIMATPDCSQPITQN